MFSLLNQEYTFAILMLSNQSKVFFRHSAPARLWMFEESFSNPRIVLCHAVLEFGDNFLRRKTHGVFEIHFSNAIHSGNKKKS